MSRGENAGMTSLRSVTTADLPALLELNNAAVPAVNALDLAQLTELVDMSAAALTVDSVECLLVALRPGLAYASANYRWFSERYPDFLYVDRIVVGPDARDAGHPALRRGRGLRQAAGCPSNHLRGQCGAAEPRFPALPQPSRLHRRRSAVRRRG